MKSNKKILMFLFLAVMVFGIVTNVVYTLNEDLYKSLYVNQKWLLIVVGLLFVTFVALAWNQPKTDGYAKAGGANISSDTISLGRWKLIALIGLGISLFGIVLFTILNSVGLLILFYAMYLYQR